MERFIDPALLNLVKDVGIGLIALLVLGKIIFTLVQAVQEFLRATREENKARNRQFEALLEINQAIANQIELTRLAIERESESNARQDKAIQDSLAEIAALHQDMTKGLEATRGQLDKAERAILDAFDRGAGTNNPAEKALLGEG